MQSSIFLYFLVLVTFVSAVEFPPQLQKCHLSDPNLDQCLTAAIENALQKNPQGFPEIGIPSLDPLKVPEMNVKAGTGAVHFNQKYTNISVIGISTFKIKNLHFDLKNKNLTFAGYGDQMQMRAKYVFKGKILILPVNGAGTSIYTLTNPVSTNSMTFNEVKKKGKVYYEIKDYSAKMTLDKLHFDYDNIFNGVKDVEERINNVFNENWQIILDDIRDGYDMAYAAIFKNIAERIFNRISIDQIFPA